MTNREYIIGINADGYPEKRNIIVPCPQGFKTKKVRDLLKLMDYLHFKLKRKNHRFFHNAFYDFNLGQVDLYHFFNTISLGKTPWVVTFENELPRFNADSKKLLKALAGSSCKKIIALSYNAKKVQEFHLKKHPEFAEQIMDKLIVLHPPQKLISSTPHKFVKGETLKLIFIGASFFRKGGKELVDAFFELAKVYSNLHLTIVSSFSIDHWFDEEYSSNDIANYKQLILQSDKITYHSHIQNDKVLELLQHSHMAFLPSYGETFGYSVLEAQACGCPVVTTNSWAFNEFNNDELGWVLDMPTIEVNGGLRADIGTVQKKHAYAKLLEQKIKDAIESVVLNPEQIEQKSVKVIQQIREQYSVQNYSEKLKTIYGEALL